MTADSHPDPDAQYEEWATDMLLRHEQGPHDPADCLICQGRWTVPAAADHDGPIPQEDAPRDPFIDGVALF